MATTAPTMVYCCPPSSRMVSLSIRTTRTVIERPALTITSRVCPLSTDDGLLLPAVKTDDGLLLPAVQDDGLLLPAVQTDDAAVFTAIAMAESGGNSDAAPHGEDSLGLWQINVEPNQYDPDAFANDLYDPPTGPAVATETLTIVHEGFWV